MNLRLADVALVAAALFWSLVALQAVQVLMEAEFQAVASEVP